MKTRDYLRAMVELRTTRHELQDLRLLVENIAHARYMGWSGVLARGTCAWALDQVRAAGFTVKYCYYQPAVMLRRPKN
ncbi:MAG: hypothetical protein JNL05_13020 [Flavobacteriales bacterium]|nr:hypothetical protein [Flavobacteriales bacterium]